jgi:hypothetical protein
MLLKASPRLVFLALALLTGSAASAQTLGACKFDLTTEAFAGTPLVQAACLLRNVKPLGRVDSQPAALGTNLTAVVGKQLPFDKVKLRALLGKRNISELDLGGELDQPLARGNNNDPAAPTARYFVIHDTSTPNFGSEQFPADINSSDRVNKLLRYHNTDNKDAVAHVFLNRRGEIYVGHAFNVPWRATKLENRIGKRSKGLFLHIENIQPRRAHPNQPDGTAPVPGFTDAQYDRLALLYLAASTRAGKGMIPAFHAAVDEGLSDGHDDPQNFKLDAFDTALGRLIAEIG